MIRFQNVTKKYKDKIAVKNLSFTIEEKGLVGLVGENGAGKTTILNMLSGFKQPTEGNIFIDSKDIAANPKEAKQKIGYLPENVPLYEGMFVIEYLQFLFDIKKPSIDKEDKQEHLLELMKKLKIDDVSHRLIKNLSKGYKQRIGLCGALIGYPEIILLDEPTSGLDPMQIKSLRKILNDLKQNHFIIFSSHILSEVSAVSDHILFVEKGQLREEGSPKHIKEKVGVQLQLVVQGKKSIIQKKIKEVKGVRTVRYQTGSGGTHTFLITQAHGADCRSQLTKHLQSKDSQLLEISKYENNLEEMFFWEGEKKKK